jgi:hypothetical protein
MKVSSALLGAAVGARRPGPDQVGPAGRLPGHQLPHRQPAAVCRRCRQGQRRQAQDHRARQWRSLFKAPEIKRAVQGGQAQIGEILLVNFANEWQIFGADGLPFLADSYDEARQAVEGAEALLRQEARRAGHDAAVRRALAAAGHLQQEAVNSAADLKGMKWRAYSPATAASPNWWARSRSRCRRPSSARPGHRRGRELHVQRLHRLRHQDLRAPEVLVRHPGLAAQERGARQQGGLRRAGQGDAGRGAEGRRRRRDARPGGQQEGQRRNLDKLKGERHADPAALARSSRPT